MSPDEMTIDNFIRHRWADAKEVLRVRDPNFVAWGESTVGLNRIGLSAPWSVDGREAPVTPLPKEWHNLLEACVELALQRTCLQVAADELNAENNRELTNLEAGKRQTYQVRSWFIHSNALVERTGHVIQKTSKVYLTDAHQAIDLERKYKESLKTTFADYVRTLRNEYAHGTVRSWSQALTKRGHWERGVAIGLTPDDFLDEHFYSPQGQKTIAGTFDFFVPITIEILQDLGKILHDLEVELKFDRTIKCRMG